MSTIRWLKRLCRYAAVAAPLVAVAGCAVERVAPSRLAMVQAAPDPEAARRVSCGCCRLRRVPHRWRAGSGAVCRRWQSTDAVRGLLRSISKSGDRLAREALFVAAHSLPRRSRTLSV